MNRARFDLVTAAATTPVTLAEMKIWLEVTDTTHDAMILGLIEGATKDAESVTWRQLISATYKAKFDNWGNGVLCIWKPACSSVTHVKYQDSNDDTITLTETTDYRVDITSDDEPVRIQIINPGSLAQYGFSKIEVQFVTGYADADACPSGIKTAIKAHVTTNFEIRQGIITGTQVNELTNWFRKALGPYIVDYV